MPHFLPNVPKPGPVMIKRRRQRPWETMVVLKKQTHVYRCIAWVYALNFWSLPTVMCCFLGFLCVLDVLHFWFVGLTASMKFLRSNVPGWNAPMQHGRKHNYNQQKQEYPHFIWGSCIHLLSSWLRLGLPQHMWMSSSFAIVFHKAGWSFPQGVHCSLVSEAPFRVRLSFLYHRVDKFLDVMWHVVCNFLQNHPANHGWKHASCTITTRRTRVP